MAKRKRSRRGLGDSGGTAESWLSSARDNFERIRGMSAKRRGGCQTIEHYTDVVAEATVAETLASERGDRPLAQRASELARTATRAQRGAVALCRRGK